MFAIDVERARGLEWSSAVNGWEILGADATIEDRVLVAPLALRDLVSAGSADEAVARALFAKRTPFVARALEASFAEGQANAIVAVLVARGLAPEPDDRDHILAMRDEAVLADWLAEVATCTSVAELIATSRA